MTAGTFVSVLRHIHNLAALPETDDARLLERFVASRDGAAFDALLRRHGPLVWRVCRRLLGDGPDAEDAFQATFLVLSQKAATIRKPASLASFLHGTAFRIARKAHIASVPREGAVPETAVGVDPATEAAWRELGRMVEEEVHGLPEKYRTVILLCYWEGQTNTEAARRLGWASGTVKTRLTRARQLLHERLTRRGVTLPAGVVVTLLAPGVVPPRLHAESVRQVAAPAPDAVRDLAAGSTSALKRKVLCLGLLVAAAVGLGGGLPLLRAPEPQRPPTAPSVPAAQAKDEPRRDRYGDPLPPGAVARLGTLRFRAPGEVVALTFAPDGKTLAVSARGGLYLFDTTSGQRLRRIPSASPDWTPDNPIVFSPDGKRLIGRGHKIVGPSVLPVVRVWELASVRQTHEYDIGQDILWLGWSSEGQPLAVRGDKNGTLHLHDLSASRSRRFACAKPHKNPAGFISRDPPLACSPRGRVLAVPDEANVIHVWDTTTGRERRTFTPKGESFYSLLFSPDGSWLVSITPKAVQMWDVAKGKELYTVDVNTNYAQAVFTSDGKTVAISNAWDRISFWDAATGKERGHTRDKDDFAPHFALSADGKWLATASRSGSALHLWDVASGRRKAEPVGHTNRPWGAVFPPDGRRVATGGSMDGTFRLWDARTGEPLLCLRQPGMARECAFSPDGRTLWASWSSGGIGLFDAATGQRRKVINLEDPDRPDTDQSVTYMYQSDDGNRLVAFSHCYAKKQAGPRHDDTLITGWDASTHKQLFRRRRPGMDSWLALSADARVLASAHPSRRRIHPPPGMGPMRLEDVATGEQLLTFPVLPGQTWPLEFSPDGRLLAANNFHQPEPDKAIRTLRLWEVLTAAEVLSLPAADFNRVAFSRDNRRMAVAAPQREIVIWDLALGCEQRRFRGFDAEVIWLRFSPDGRQLVSGLADSTLLIWDVGAPVPPRKLGAEAAAKAWTDLAATDAARAFRARGMLTSAPDEALPLLQMHLRPAQAADAQRVRRLLPDLESEQFAVREKAQVELEQLGELAEPALRQTLANKPSLEVRRRVQGVLEHLRGPVTRPEVLRPLRAVAVLEDIGTPAARRLLEELSKGAPEACLTRDAKTALRRLALRKR